MKILITGGHLSPALALIEKIRATKPDWQIVWVGRVSAMEGDPSLAPEYRVLPTLKVEFITLTTGRLQRKFTARTLISLAKIPFGLVSAFKIVWKQKPQVIVSFGSYQAVPVVIAGWLLKVPILTHEQTVEAGLANRIIARFANKIAVSHKESVKYFPINKTVVTGNPLRLSVFAKEPTSPALKHFLKTHGHLQLIYVTGGSQGSHFINQIVFSCLKKLLNQFALVLQTGDSQIFRDYEVGLALVKRLDSRLVDRFYLTKFLEGADLGAVLNRADLVIARAGANTVTELAALGKPAIFIPLPFAQKQEQQKNAELLAKLGAAVILQQSTLTPRKLMAKVNNLAQNIAFYKKQATKAKKLVDRTAVDKLMMIVEELVS